MHHVRLGTPLHSSRPSWHSWNCPWPREMLSQIDYKATLANSAQPNVVGRDSDLANQPFDQETVPLDEAHCALTTSPDQPSSALLVNVCTRPNHSLSLLRLVQPFSAPEPSYPVPMHAQLRWTALMLDQRCLWSNSESVTSCNGQRPRCNSCSSATPITAAIITTPMTFMATPTTVIPLAMMTHALISNCYGIQRDLVKIIDDECSRTTRFFLLWFGQLTKLTRKDEYFSYSKNESNDTLH